MIRTILFVILLLTSTFANTTKIKELQNQFKENVIEVNIYRKRFATYLKKNCDDNFECFKSNINRLKSWDTVKNDKFLKYIKNERLSKIQFNKEYWEQLQYKLKAKNIDFGSSQFVSVIDLEKQYYILTLWDNEKKDFEFIGKDLISSGNIKREAEVKFGEDHYLKTPAGVFTSKMGWRSDGKFSDDNVTQGFGVKDRFVFYFGKQKTIRYNTFDKEGNKIYDVDKWKLISDKLDFALHSHKSSAPFGEPYSHGCVRMTDELNRFLDNNLVLHQNLFDGSKWLHKYSKAPNNPQNHNFAGKYLIIFDNI